MFILYVQAVCQPGLHASPHNLSGVTFFYRLQLTSHSFCLPVALFPVEDNGTAVVLSAVAGSSMQGTAVSETLYVPEPFSVACYPLLQDRLALCSCCHRPSHRGATSSRELYYR